MRLIDADSIEFVLAPIAPLLKGVTIDDKPVFRRVALKEAIDKIPAVDQWTSVNDWIPMAPQYCEVVVEEEDTMTADQYRYVYPKFARYVDGEWVDVDGRLLSKPQYIVWMWKFAPGLPEELDI